MKIFLALAVLAAVFLGGAYLLFWGSDPARSWVPASAPGISYQYPESLGTDYVSAVEWPPLVEKVVNEYSCSTGAAAVDGPATEISERVISGRTYCVSVSSEGAAGSTYRTYEYSADLGDMVVRAQFTLRYPQCANYDEPQQAACREGQESVDPDQLADGIVSTIAAE